MTNLTDCYSIGSYIDTFALGHYARVLEAQDLRYNKTVAFKVMRSEHLSRDGEIKWEFRAFINEAELLMKLADSPHVVDLTDCGYVSSYLEVPQEGEIASYGRDVAAFARDMVDYAQKNWRPYICMPVHARTNSLFYLMKTNQQGIRWRLPTEEGLALAIQFAHVLQMAHQQGIVYLDHKLEHVYWDGTKLLLIDFNSSRQLNGRTTEDQFFLMDVHNLCVGVLYPIFTGLSPLKTTLKPQPGNYAQAETRYQNITELDFGVEPSLSQSLKDLLQAGASMELQTVDQFIDGLEQVAAAHGWDFPELYTNPSNRSARDKMRAGLRDLREGQARLRAARDHFRDGAIQMEISEDLEDELRRLVKSVNDMLNHRVIP